MNLMQLVGIWLSTIVLSYAMEIKVVLKLIKDIADAGYKINDEKLSEFSNKFKSQVSNRIDLNILNMIPFVNVYTAMKSMIEGTVFIEHVFLELKVIGALEEMSELEKEEYFKRPTAINAIAAPIKVKARLEDAILVKYDDFYGKGEIYFEYEDQKINILQVTGPASRLTIQEQEEIIKKNCLNTISLVLDNLGFEGELKEKYLKVVNIFDKNEDNNLTVDEGKMLAERVKECIETNTEVENYSSNINNKKDVKRKVLRKENDKNQ